MSVTQNEGGVASVAINKVPPLCLGEGEGSMACVLVAQRWSGLGFSYSVKEVEPLCLLVSVKEVWL